MRLLNKMDKYTLDKCCECGQYKALKNGKCADCDKKLEIPDFFKDLFKK